MTIKECIDIVDSIKPNQYTVEDKVMWLSFIDAIIINDVLKTHEGYDGRYDLFEGYSADKLSVRLIVPSPYDRLYTAYLQMKIDGANGETARYNNSAALYNAYMTEYRKHYNKTHMPLDVTNNRRDFKPTQKVKVGLSDAEYENLKRDLFYLLSEHFSTFVSPDKLYDIVTSYAQNNVELLKGKEGAKGDDGDKGKDGGYYIPSVNQTSDSTVTLRFTPNEATMGEGYGTVITLPHGATGAKGADGKSPRINDEGYWEIYGGDLVGWIGTPCKATGHSPYIGENGNWYTWSEESADYVDTGIAAQGEADLEDIPVASLEGVIYVDKENLVSGTYTNNIINADGSLTTHVSWALWDDVIDVPNPGASTIYRFNNTGTSTIVLYREDGTVYSRKSLAAGAEKSYTITNTSITKVRITEQITNLTNGQTWAWEEVTEFVPYGAKPGYNYDGNPMYADLDKQIEEVKDQISVKYPKLRGKRWLFMGDSITKGVGASNINTTSYFAKCVEMSGAIGTNIGVGGASISFRGQSTDDTYPSIYRLSTETDFTQYDIVTILAGTNDFGSPVELTDISETYRESEPQRCVVYALEKALENIFTSNPNIRVMVFAPFYRDRYLSGDGLNSDDYGLPPKRDYDVDWGSSDEKYFLSDLADKMVGVCKKKHVCCRNLLEEFELNRHNASLLLSDGIHPSDEGHERIAKIICQTVSDKLDL